MLLYINHLNTLYLKGVKVFDILTGDGFGQQETYMNNFNILLNFDRHLYEQYVTTAA